MYGGSLSPRCKRIEACSPPKLALHAGLATSAAERGQHERDIMQQARHKSVKMLRRYIRNGSLFQGNVVDALGF